MAFCMCELHMYCSKWSDIVLQHSPVLLVRMRLF